MRFKSQKKVPADLPRLIEKRTNLISSILELNKKLDRINKKIINLDYTLTGPAYYLYLKKIVEDVKDGLRPISIEEIERGIELQEVDRDEIKSFAEACAQREQLEKHLYNERQKFMDIATKTKKT